MKTHFKYVGILAVVFAASIALFVSNQPGKVSVLSPANPMTSQNRLLQAYADLPMYFEANFGQTDGSVSFLARGRGYTLFLTPGEAVFSLNQSRQPETKSRVLSQRSPERNAGEPLRLRLAGAYSTPRVSGEQPLPGVSHYFIGNDPGKWRTNVPHYARVRYEQVYPGIDLVYRGGGSGSLEYDLIVAPGADPSRIRLAFDGAEDVRVGADGNLVLRTASGDVVQKAPVIFQEANGERQMVDGGYQLLRSGEVGFRIGTYRVELPLVIDPTIAYSTYLGGSDLDFGVSISADPFGDAYVMGETTSADFPTVGGLPGTLHGLQDVFVTRIDSSGTKLVYSGFFGGSDRDEGSDISVTATQQPVITGATRSTDFPTIAAIQPTFPGTTAGFVLKLSQQGLPMFSTYLGGVGDSLALGVVVGDTGQIYVGGMTNDVGWPFGCSSVGPLGGSDAFVVKLTPAGDSVLYCTFVGGSADDANLFFNLQGLIGDFASDHVLKLALDSTADQVYVGTTSQSSDFPQQPAPNPIQPGGFAGNQDVVVFKLSTDGSSLIYSTYLGGQDSENFGAIAADVSGNAYVTGNTLSTDFPIVPNPSVIQPGGLGGGASGIPDVFVTKIDAGGTALLFSTFVGGLGGDWGLGIGVDGNQNIYASGRTTSSDFPVLSPLPASTCAMNAEVFQNGFAFKIAASGQAFVYSTCIPGTFGVTDIHVDNSGGVYLTGGDSLDDLLPIVPPGNPINPAGSNIGDAFVMKFAGGASSGNDLVIALKLQFQVTCVPPCIPHPFVRMLDLVSQSLTSPNADVRADAPHLLGAFINLVEAQRGKQLTDADADRIISLANSILVLITPPSPIRPG